MKPGAEGVAALRSMLAEAKAAELRWRKQAEKNKDGRAIRIFKTALENSAATRVQLGARLEEALKAADALRDEREKLTEENARQRQVLLATRAAAGLREGDGVSLVDYVSGLHALVGTMAADMAGGMAEARRVGSSADAAVQSMADSFARVDGVCTRLKKELAEEKVAHAADKAGETYWREQTDAARAEAAGLRCEADAARADAALLASQAVRAATERNTERAESARLQAELREAFAQGVRVAQSELRTENTRLVGWNRALQGLLNDGVTLRHMATATPFRPLCGSDVPGQATTDHGRAVTCPMCHAATSDKQAIRQPEAAKP